MAFNKSTHKPEVFESILQVPSTGYQKMNGSIHRELTKSDGKGHNAMVVCTFDLDDFKNVKYTNEAVLHRLGEPKGGLTGGINYLICIDGAKNKHGRILVSEVDHYRSYIKESTDTMVWDPKNSYKAKDWSWVVRVKEGTTKEYLPKEFETKFGVKYEKLPRVTGGIGYTKVK